MVVVEMDQILLKPAMRVLGATAVAALVCGLTGLYLAVFAGQRISSWGVVPQPVRRVFSSIHEYRRKPSSVPAALALSICNQMLTLLVFYMGLRSTGVAGMPVAIFFLTVPLGLVTTAVPIAPAGIGVGQAAFFAIMQAVDPRYTTSTIAALTVYQALFILLCLSGLFWYIPYKQTVPPGGPAEGEAAAPPSGPSAAVSRAGGSPLR
jgi:hypothetical protein